MHPHFPTEVATWKAPHKQYLGPCSEKSRELSPPPLLVPSREEHRLTRIHNRQPHFSSQTRQLASCEAKEDRNHSCFFELPTSSPSSIPLSQGLPTPVPGGTRAGPEPQSSKVRQRDSHKGEDGDDGHCDEQLDGDDAINLQHRRVNIPHFWPLPRKQPAPRPRIPMTLLLPCLLTLRRTSFLILKDPLFVSTREPSPAAARWSGWLQYYPHPCHPIPVLTSSLSLLLASPASLHSQCGPAVAAVQVSIYSEQDAVHTGDGEGRVSYHHFWLPVAYSQTGERNLERTEHFAGSTEIFPD